MSRSSGIANILARLAHRFLMKEVPQEIFVRYCPPTTNLRGSSGDDFADELEGRCSLHFIEAPFPNKLYLIDKGRIDHDWLATVVEFAELKIGQQCALRTKGKELLNHWQDAHSSMSITRVEKGAEIAVFDARGLARISIIDVAFPYPISIRLGRNHGSAWVGLDVDYTDLSAVEG